MGENIIYTACPACSHRNIIKVLVCRDETVSKELFEIWECRSCSLRFTQNAPDPTSSGKYYQSSDYVSHSNTKEGLINRLYHIIRSYTLQAKKKLVKQTSDLKTGALLDVGAGTGSFSATMKQAGWTVTGIEPDETARANAMNEYNIRLQTPDDLLQIPPQSIDVITLWHVLEHVHDLHGYLQKFHVILKPGGKLLIAVPNYTSKDAAIYGEYWAAFDVPRHLYHFSPRSMENLLVNKGFRLHNVKPMWFDSFYVSMLSEQYKYGKKNLLRAFWNNMKFLQIPVEIMYVLKHMP